MAVGDLAADIADTAMRRASGITVILPGGMGEERMGVTRADAGDVAVDARTGRNGILVEGAGAHAVGHLRSARCARQHGAEWRALVRS